MEWCQICAAYVYGSHYHCVRCWKESSMMGHRDCIEAPEPERTPKPFKGEPAEIIAPFQPPEVVRRLREEIS